MHIGKIRLGRYSLILPVRPFAAHFRALILKDLQTAILPILPYKRSLGAG